MALPSFTLDNLRPGEESVTVFMCRNCRLPLGDSSDWDGHMTSEPVVHLRAVTPNVCTENDAVVSSYPNETGCVFQILQCKGCGIEVGRLYISTTKDLDSKVDVFTLNISAITTYTIGTAKKQAVPPCDAPVTLESCQIFQEELKKCKRFLTVLQRKVEFLESKILHPSADEDGYDS